MWGAEFSKGPRSGFLWNWFDTILFQYVAKCDINIIVIKMSLFITHTCISASNVRVVNTLHFKELFKIQIYRIFWFVIFFCSDLGSTKRTSPIANESVKKIWKCMTFPFSNWKTSLCTSLMNYREQAVSIIFSHHFGQKLSFN